MRSFRASRITARLCRMDNLLLGIKVLTLVFLTGLVLFVLYSFVLQDINVKGNVMLPRREELFFVRREPCLKSNPCKVKIIADLDQDSRIVEPDSSRLQFHSYLLNGMLYKQMDNYIVEWDPKEIEVIGEYNEAGRGMELSELILYADKLYTFDDRSGTIFELSEAGAAIPKYVLTEGDGNTKKGMKIEWATIKDDKLWVGSFGKEYTKGGKITSENNFWVSTIDRNGKIQYYDWKPVYATIRSALGASYPGYVIHEAVNWSHFLKRWIFLPRRVSAQPYDDKQDEKRGSNRMVIATEDFSATEVRDVGVLTPERGFSSFKFIPGTEDRAILALKSVEDSETGEQKSYITAFTLDGAVLLEETLIPSPHKYEGLEIIS